MAILDKKPMPKDWPKCKNCEHDSYKHVMEKKTCSVYLCPCPGFEVKNG
jgi:hypothetical protein